MQRIRSRLYGAWKRSGLLVVSVLALAMVLSAGLLGSCIQDVGITVNPAPSKNGLPIVRVKLGPVTSFARVATSGSCRIKANGRTVRQYSGPISGEVSLAGTTWRIGGGSYSGHELAIEPSAGGLVYAGSACYRGSLHLVAQSYNTFVVVNHVDMDSYLAGVLPKELMTKWSYETYRALAIAARTFAMYQRSTCGPGRDCDLGDSEGSQVYDGYSAEVLTPYSRRAVDSTRGQVLACTQNGSLRIFLAQYSACCGGVVNGAYVIRDARMDPPLRGGQTCIDCRNCPRYYWPTVRVYKGEIYGALLARYPDKAYTMGGVTGISVASSTPYGRAVWIDVFGPTGGSIRVRSEDLRLAWNMTSSASSSGRRLPSMNCTIRTNADSFDFCDGRGFGHGVGLCQWGAQAKAASGWKAQQILSYYYPGATIIKAY